MAKRTLTLTLDTDWKRALRRSGRSAGARSYQRERLNFEGPAAFFGHMTERRWALVNASGYAGVDTPLFYKANNRMLFGDAKKMLDDLLVHVVP